jgi:hypothetical protein
MRAIEGLTKRFMHRFSSWLNKKKLNFAFSLNESKKTKWFVHKKTKRWHPYSQWHYSTVRTCKVFLYNTRQGSCTPFRRHMELITVECKVYYPTRFLYSFKGGACSTLHYNARYTSLQYCAFTVYYPTRFLYSSGYLSRHLWHQPYITSFGSPCWTYNG